MSPPYLTAFRHNRIMANTVARKTFKVEFEISVGMEEIQDEHLHSPLAIHGASFLRHLQQALLDDEAVLLEVMRSRMMMELQEYVDYMAAQNSRAGLINAAERLEEKDRRFLRLHREEFDRLTRPLRVDSLSTCIEDSRIEEKIEVAPWETRPCGPSWREIWRDMFLASRLGKMVKKLFLPETHVEVFPKPETAHYLVLKYMTQEVDGVHVEARCTCDKPLYALGEDESDALEMLWDTFQEHYHKYQPI